MTTVALVPAYRRADRVGATVISLTPLVDEVVVADDGSADGGATAEAARRAGARVIALPANRGKGGAVEVALAAAPGAAVYLLVDADTAATAAATEPLLAAVAAGADLAIGVLPPASGRGGFGSVRRLARWGIVRACGFEAAAPLSGQRAVRGKLLRSLEAADRFGLEVGMTIDAVRAGAKVVEVPVQVDHAHTGRGPAGFAHRGAQGFDLLRALWPRLLTERSRLVLLVGAAVAVVAVLAARGAAAVPVGAPLGRADRVILVAAPATLGLGDLADPARPELAALAGRRGSVAAANVDVPGRSPWSSWATVGAGRKLRARPPSRPPDPAEPFLVAGPVHGSGRLGDTLHQAGRTTAFVGAEVTSALRLAVADSSGRIDRAASAGSLGVAGLVNRVRADAGAGASLVAVDGSSLGPVGLDDLLARLHELEDGRTLLLLVTPADPAGTFGLRPLLASGPGAPAGRLVSPSTRRNGLVLLTDVAPTVLDVLGVPVPDDLLGRPLRRAPSPADVQGLVEADRLARQRDSVWDPALAVVVPLHFVAYGLGWRRSRRRNRVTAGAAHLRGGAEDAGRSGTAGPATDGPPASASVDRMRSEHRGSQRPAGPWLSWMALGLVAWPLATWLVRAVPASGSLGRWAGLLAVAVDAVVVAAAWRGGRRRGLAPFALVVAATLVLVTVDLGVGGPLQVSSAFGGAAHSTGRFTGLGNAAFAVYAGCALVAVACARRRAPWIVALLLGVALVDVLPPLGADVGGAVTLVPVFVVTVAALWGRLRVRVVAVAGAVTAAVLAVALALDLSRPDDQRTHLARFAAGGARSSSIGGKLAQNLDTYRAIPMLVGVVGVALVFAVLLWRGRFRHNLPPGSPARTAVAAALAVALLGNVLNDSGAIVTLLVLSVLSPYLVARVAAEEPAPRTLPPERVTPPLRSP